MSMNLGYCKELLHLQMNPMFPLGQWPCEASFVHSPYQQDRQLHSSSQFIEGTSGSDKLISKTKSKLPWIRLSNFTPAISVRFCSAYRSDKHSSLFLKQSPNVHLVSAQSSNLQNIISSIVILHYLMWKSKSYHCDIYLVILIFVPCTFLKCPGIFSKIIPLM